MQRLILPLLAPLLTLLLVLSVRSPLAAAAPAKYDPDDGYHHYVQWSDFARKAAAARYPGASLTDMRYVGCEAVSSSSKRFVYRFWLREGAAEFGAYVTVEAANGTGKARVKRIEKSEGPVPSYGKWERYAAEAVRRKYPGAEIVGAKPFGCDCADGRAASQTFRFWIRQEGRSRLIRVTVAYRIRTDQVVAVRFENLSGFEPTWRAAPMHGSTD
ncbi:DUF3889 domain-containing protein [Paenibacillus glycinis]|uniref:DUF3889 domain-containing protein n=1 Tax=Paenibacillus glycinis TaxID=2697035 RepID=A0ABW9XWM3_9BACL|nr:DUF3889 domain-containing protein [Paenibacillus glycinis]NBD27090.1 DUF3889 domain-containing protein [Paenibacillus glycinis]